MKIKETMTNERNTANKETTKVDLPKQNLTR